MRLPYVRESVRMKDRAKPLEGPFTGRADFIGIESADRMARHRSCGGESSPVELHVVDVEIAAVLCIDDFRRDSFNQALDMLRDLQKRHGIESVIRQTERE